MHLASWFFSSASRKSQVVQLVNPKRNSELSVRLCAGLTIFQEISVHLCLLLLAIT